MMKKKKYTNLILLFLVLTVVLAGVGYRQSIADSFFVHSYGNRTEDTSFIQGAPSLLVSGKKSEEESVQKSESSLIKSFARNRISAKSKLLMGIIAVSLFFVFLLIFVERYILKSLYIRCNSVCFAEYVHAFDGSK